MVITFDKPLVLDGGLGMELQRSGFPLDGDPLWSCRVLVKNPEAVKNVHLKFLRAGAHVIETCSYQATIPGLMNDLHVGLPEAEEIIVRSVKVALEAVDEFRRGQSDEEKRATAAQPILVAGSIGPFGVVRHDRSEYSGAYLRGDVSDLQIAEYYLRQAKLLVDAGVDILAFETIPATHEAEIICNVLRANFAPDTNAWISFSCKSERETCFGDLFADAVAAVSQNCDALAAVGVNCTSIEHIGGLLRSAKPHTSKPFVVYPNLPDPEKATDASKKRLSECCDECIAEGAVIIGGCCHITPELISQMSTHIIQKYH